MQAAPVDKSALSRSFDLVVMISGLAFGLASLARFLAVDEHDTRWIPTGMVGLALIVLISRFPLQLSRAGSGIQVGFESAVLVAVVVQGAQVGALALWSVAQVLTQLSKRKRWDLRLFNTAVTILCGVAAVSVMHRLNHLGSSSLAELGSVGTGCAVFFAVDYLLSALSLALEERTSLWSHLHYSNSLLAGLAFIGINSLGYLAALVNRALPGWANVLLVVPLITILVASRALSRGGEHQRRLTSLFDGAGAIQGAASREQVLELLQSQAEAVLARPASVVRSYSPSEHEVGARVSGTGQALWLVAPRGEQSHSTRELDQQALEALTGVGEQTLARLALLDRLGRQARQDGLTGLANRVLFTRRLELALASASARAQVAVLYLDLDGFKSVNDRFGHGAGDDLLRIVADRLSPLAGPSGCLARLGGDEFAILLPQVCEWDKVDRLCQDVLFALRQEAVVAGHGVLVGTSIGVVLSAGGDEASEVLRNADMAMYRAKALGKNQHVLYQGSLRADRIRRLELIEALRAGIDHELVVVYQPMVDLRTGRIEGLEALVRWQRSGMLLAPDLFIPAAEDSGLIVPLGQVVLDQVAADSARLAQAAGRPIELAVNMSAHQLRDTEFVHQVERAVTACDGCQLVLEMTETVLVQDDPQTSATLDRLKGAGARLAIDDFGVGFSSIGYLQHLPVDVVKIDRSFVRDIDTLPRAQALVDAIVVMAAALELDVVAEGIEREEQAQMLRRAGCTQGQGYLFAVPLMLEEAVHHLRRDRAMATGRRN